METLDQEVAELDRQSAELAQRALDALRLEIDRRLFDALQTAGRSALGMPGTVDILKLGSGCSHYPAT